jgi:hypothetical protein
MLDDRLFFKLHHESMKKPSKVLAMLERLGWFPSLVRFMREKEALRMKSANLRMLFATGLVMRSSDQRFMWGDIS